MTKPPKGDIINHVAGKERAPKRKRTAHQALERLRSKRPIRWCGSMAEQLICNQQVGGSTPFTSSNLCITILYMGEFPSGQRGQTVNLLSVTSVVRIHLPPPNLNRNILIQNYGSVFLPENTVISVFLQKEKFLCNNCRAKIKVFLTITRQFCSLRNFLLIIMHRFRLFFRSKAVHYFICSLYNSFCSVTFVNNNLGDSSTAHILTVPLLYDTMNCI